MFLMGDWTHEIKEYFDFSKDERNSLIISTIFVTFIFWITSTQEYLNITGILFIFIISLVTILVHRTVQKIFGLRKGYFVRYKVWITGLVIGLGLTVLSSGKLILILPGTIWAVTHERLRLGKSKFSLEYKNIAWIAITGVMATIGLALILKLLVIRGYEPIFERAIKIILLYSLGSLLPLPYTDGMNMLYASRWTYLFFVGFMVGLIVFINFASLLTTLIASFLFGFIFWLVFYLKVQRDDD